jgi:hypothetical protein
VTSILNIDATTQSWQQDNGRSSAKDFANELAKHDERAKSEAQAKPDVQSNAKTNTDTDLTSQQRPATEEPAAAATQSELPSATPADQLTLTTQAEMQQLEQATVTPTGVTQVLLSARVFGWHAMAQAYLSELTMAEGDADQHAPSKEQALSSITAAADDTETTAANVPANVATAEIAALSPQAEYVTQIQTRQVSDSATSPNIAELAETDTAASSYWSERSIRFTRQRDGSSVAWLRDFRISDTEASHLIQFVLDDAKAKGVVLSKIMLNGREAWASSQSH